MNKKIDDKIDLTGREKEVLQCLKYGRTSRGTANILGITERTVKFHICNIIRKLKAENRTQAVVMALEGGLLDQEARL